MKNKECLEGGIVTNAVRILKNPTECSVCNKLYVPKNKELIFRRSKDGGIDLMCDSCYEKFVKSWELDTVLEWLPIDSFRGTAVCKMSSGRTFDYYYEGYGKTINDGIPENFAKKLYQLKDKYYEEKRGRIIKTIEYVESFDVQKMVVTQYNGNVTTLHYKIGRNGFIFDPKDTAKVEPELMGKILEKINKDKALGAN